ncbi:unnamed protein product [Diabrotica balteata]|uniref:Alpha-carbonic anhydrase domain-containing protein n=1 Tax=Diabrotica balteata TaxID=107213 RepID=A0A9N9SRE6_DIABA|nr:unnamed protein product [Diabrotica balteata]
MQTCKFKKYIMRYKIENIKIKFKGPGYWGLMNPQWNMCSKGRRQSPINVEPDKLLFDPYLRHIHIDKHKVNGMLHNTGQSLVFRIDKDSKTLVNITGGPLAYRYQFEEIYIHYGIENQQGSEHYIHGYSFPAELAEIEYEENSESLENLDDSEGSEFDEVEIQNYNTDSEMSASSEDEGDYIPCLPVSISRSPT